MSPVTNVGSRWSAGDLIFYEHKVSEATIADVLKIGDDAVTVSSATNDINFSWLGTTTGTFVLDAGAHTLAMTGLATSTDGAVTITNATATSSTTTGALIVTGGIATAADITCGDDLFLSSSGAVINFYSGDITITHSANALAFAGATSGYSFDDTVTSTDTTAGFVASGAATDGISITGACTDGIDISGACTYAIDVSASQTAAFYYVVNQTVSEGAWVHGVKVETTRTADAVIASGGYYGAQIVVNKGSDSYTNGMSPNTYGCQVVIKGANTKNNTYGLAVETQSSGYVDYLSRFLLSSGTSLAAAGAMMYLQSYVNANIGLKIGELTSATTMTSGIYFEDNAGTGGAITSLIGFDTRNSTNLLKCDYAAGCVAANTHAIDGHALQHILTVDIGGDTGYIPVFAAVPA